VAEKPIQALIEENFEADSQQLPVFSPVALELQKMKADDGASMAQITALILRDQALASRILQAANSSFFVGLRKVETVSHAVVRLGIERVANLALMASQAQAHHSRVPVIGAYLPLLWRRAFASALGARWVAERTGYRARAEEAFLAGLLHDIGELFLLKVLERLVQDPERPLPLTQPLMREILEAMHPGMGYRLMQTWELPEQYALIAQNHHSRDLNEGDVLMVITQLLDIACQKLGIGQPANPDIVLAATMEARSLGLKDIALAELEIMLEDTLAAAEAMR
jgi:HD-like signal output (HDOD) protein